MQVIAVTDFRQRLLNGDPPHSTFQSFCNRANVLRNLATLGAATAMQ